MKPHPTTEDLLQHEAPARDAIAAATPIADEYLGGIGQGEGIWDLLDRLTLLTQVEEHIYQTGTVPGPHDLAMWLIDEGIGRDSK